MLALVVDRTHHCLLEAGRVPDVPFAGEARPLRAVEARFAADGAALPVPAGSRARSDSGRDFLFVADRFAAPPGMEWIALRAAGDDAWRLYVETMLGGYEPPSREVDVWSFGDRPEAASRLAHLVACGAKRVTMAWLEASKRSGTPVAYDGGVSVVTDGFGYPRLILRTTDVRKVPFAEVDAASAAGEGEGDLTYDDWREGHEAYFAEEAGRLGLVFDSRVLIVIERFEVLHVVGRADV